MKHVTNLSVKEKKYLNERFYESDKLMRKFLDSNSENMVDYIIKQSNKKGEK